MAPSLAVSIHDVAPATWPAARVLVALCDRIGAAPLTLLVVPRFHRTAAAEDDPAFVRAIDARLARGDEVALHGLVHLDDAPAPRTPLAWLERRVLTRAEGEFAAIGEADAASRLAQGLAMWRRIGWPIAGFVPPAWLLGAAAQRAIAGAGASLRYVALRRGLYRLPEWTWTRTGNAAFSPGSALRRLGSRALIAGAVAATPSERLLRLALHPQDVAGPGVLEHWSRVIRDTLRERAPVTELAWVDRARGLPRAHPA